MWLPILVTVLVGYFLGNLNGAVSMSSLTGHADIRTQGSGNAGFTNFLRNYGARGAVLVGIIDFLKAVLGCLAGGLIMSAYGLSLEGRALGGLAVILGHNFPVLLGFRGGKGILCSAALGLMLDWRVFLIIFVVFVGLYFITRLVSLASCVAVVVFTVSLCLFHRGNVWIMSISILVGLLGLFMHRANIGRLLHGTERKTYLRKKKD